MRGKGKKTRGELKDCLIYFGNLIDFKNPEHLAMIRALSEISKISEAMLTAFLKGEKIPDGLNELRLYCCFATMGFEVIEFVKKQTPYIEMVELLGYNVVSPQYAVERTGYSKPFNMYEAIRKEFKKNTAKLEAVWKLRMEYKEALAAAKNVYQERLRTIAGFVSRSLEPSSIHNPKVEPRNPPLFSEHQLTGGSAAKPVLMIMEGLHAWLESGEQQKLLASDLSFLRAHERTIDGLSAYFNALKNALVSIQERKGGEHGPKPPELSGGH